MGNATRSPFISIVTSTVNAAQSLPATIESVRQQTFTNFEWIVVDGASNDDTVALLEANQDVITRWLSESDTGIYNAWNKACSMIRGEWIQFLGAGDRLAGPHVLAEVAKRLQNAWPRYELAYGNLQYVAPATGEILRQFGKPWAEMRGQWLLYRPLLPVHPEVFHHRSLLAGKAPFDESLRVAADSKLMLQSVLTRDPLYFPILVDTMPLDGISSTLEGNIAAAKEIWRINTELGIKPPLTHVLHEHCKLVLKMFLVKLFRPATLERLVNAIRGIRRALYGP